MRTTRLAVIAAIAVALAAGHAPSQDRKQDPPPAKKTDPKTAQAKLMIEKLKHAQTLLDGLATNDFTKITRSADELLLISKTAEFTSGRKTRDYQLHTNNFRRALEEITRKAKEKNLEGATLGYVDMTLTCVRCHQHTRETVDARLPLPAHLGGSLGGE
jgi:hypothetical protein